MPRLHDVVTAGKARCIGASSMYARQFAGMNHVAGPNGWTRFVPMPPQLNLSCREEEREMLPLGREEGVGVIPWSLLAQGFLAGNRTRDGGGETTRAKTDPFANHQDADFAVRDVLTEVAKARGLSNMQVAPAGVLGRPGITAPMIGAGKPNHIGDALSAPEATLSPDEIEKPEAPYRPRSVANLVAAAHGGLPQTAIAGLGIGTFRGRRAPAPAAGRAVSR